MFFPDRQLLVSGSLGFGVGGVRRGGGGGGGGGAGPPPPPPTSTFFMVIPNDPKLIEYNITRRKKQYLAFGDTVRHGKSQCADI
jgi:hypothetical protein